MLEQMHKHMKWLMWTIVIVITVAFLFFGIMPSGPGGRAVASVNGDVITIDELNRVYQNMVETYRGILKDQMNEDFRKSLRVQAFRELIANRLLVQEADRVGLRVTKKELQNTIMKIPAFSAQGRFDKGRYDWYLRRINSTPAEFEASQRDFLLRQKLEQIIRDGVDVPDSELSEQYKARNPRSKAKDFAQNKDNFRQQVLAEKQNGMLAAFINQLQDKAEIKIYDDSFML